MTSKCYDNALIRKIFDISRKELVEQAPGVIIINKGKIVYDDKVPKRRGRLEKVFREVTLDRSQL